MKKRIIEIDLLRGLAVVGMIVYHFLFVMWYFGMADFALREGGLLVLARSVQLTFLSLVGVSLVLSFKNRPDGFLYRNWRRAIIVAFGALLVTVGTFVSAPEYYIRFGILHFISVAIVIASLFVRLKWTNLLIAGGIFAFYSYISAFSVDSFWAFIIGLPGFDVSSFDYFPILRWLPVVFVGMFVGSFVAGKSGFIKREGFLKPLAFLGRHAFIIYLVHVPLIVGFLLSL